LVSELQSYILSTTTETISRRRIVQKSSASIVHPFNNNWNFSALFTDFFIDRLQSYILSTTTETSNNEFLKGHQNELQSYILSTTTETLTLKKSKVASGKLQSYILSTTTETDYETATACALAELQSYILSTTTETWRGFFMCGRFYSFNRTSFQQQLKRHKMRMKFFVNRFNRTSFQQQLKQRCSQGGLRAFLLQSYILSTTTETFVLEVFSVPRTSFNRTSFQQQLKPENILQMKSG